MSASNSVHLQVLRDELERLNELIANCEEQIDAWEQEKYEHLEMRRRLKARISELVALGYGLS